MNPPAALACLASLVCGSSLLAQSTLELVDVSATTRLWAEEVGCDFEPGESCFKEIAVTVQSLDDLPIQSDAVVNNPLGVLHGWSTATASFDDDGLFIAIDTDAPGHECCLGDEFFYFHARAEVAITFNLPEAAYVRLAKNRVNTHYDPSDMGTANGTSHFTLLNADTAEVIEENNYGLSELLLEAGTYTIQLDTYAWTSCNCRSSLFQSITISDRPVPSVVVVEEHSVSATATIDGVDTTADESVYETMSVFTLEDLPATVSHNFYERFGWDTWRGSASTSALVSPNRVTLWGNSHADSSATRTWGASTVFDFSFTVTQASNMTYAWCFDHEEDEGWGSSIGETTSRIRIASLGDGGAGVLFDQTYEAIGTECGETSLELEPGEYIIWCDSLAESLSETGSATRTSRSELDMLFTPIDQGNPADFNGDGSVNGADLGSLIAAWGPCDGCPQDLTGDGQVDGADLGLLFAAWTG